jgi:hypothetical protein
VKPTLTHTFGALATALLLGTLTPACAVATDPSPVDAPAATGREESCGVRS